MDASHVYRVQARNLSHASENKIHDNDVARRFGFRGGLVPGVEVYAYMTHLPVARWGADWLERGTAECRFLKPVYDGNVVTVSATETHNELAIAVESEGERCATGSAALDGAAQTVAPVWESTPIPPFDARPDADEASLAIGRRLSSHPLQLTRDRLHQYLSDIRESEPLYARENLAHPALMLRLCNSALKDNVKLGPWIHVASSIRHRGLARAGDSLAAHAAVTANYERNGHRMVDLDVLILANGVVPVTHVRHTAIYRLRSAQ
jgi:acyl dehydratase